MANKKIESVSKKPITPTMEDYLEAIFNLGKEKRVVRVKDISKRLGVKMPTVTDMLKTLNERGFIDYEKYEYLELTDEGTSVGKEIHRRHQVLRRFLTDILNIDIAKADGEACKMEHAVSSATLDRFIEFMVFIQECPRAGDNWIHRFEEYCLHGKGQEKCLAYMEEFADGFTERMKTIGKKEEKDRGAKRG